MTVRLLRISKFPVWYLKRRLDNKYLLRTKYQVVGAAYKYYKTWETGEPWAGAGWAPAGHDSESVRRQAKVAQCGLWKDFIWFLVGVTQYFQRQYLDTAVSVCHIF